MTTSELTAMNAFFAVCCGTYGSVPDCRGKQCEHLNESCTHPDNPLEKMLKAQVI